MLSHHRIYILTTHIFITHSIVKHVLRKSFYCIGGYKPQTVIDKDLVAEENADLLKYSVSSSSSSSSSSVV